MDVYGSNVKQNSRSVSKGFSQIHGVDYTYTFSPVAKIDSIRLVLVITASKRWKVKRDFIHGDLHEEIYIQKPKYFIHDPSLVCRLNKSLYGLDKSPRAWYAKMDNILLSLGYER